MAHYGFFYQLANVASQLKHVLLGSSNVVGAMSQIRNCSRSPHPHPPIPGALKLEASAKGSAEEELTPHSIRSGGDTAMFHAGLGLSGIKEWCRWVAASSQGYLRYVIGAMRGGGGKMAIATGVVKYTKANPHPSESVTPRSAGK